MLRHGLTTQRGRAVWSASRIARRLALGVLAAALAPATALAATADPPGNRILSQTTVQACQANSAATTCETSALADLNAARAAEGIGPMQPPGDFGTRPPGP
jgi:hypothetical protein